MNAKKKLIITDDDPGIQDAAKLIFERAGYEVTVFSSGESLLSGAFNVPDLFILDKQLSGVDGLDICRFLKKHTETKNIPIIILSASPHIGKLASSAGADAFLEKPFKMRELREVAQRLIPE
jgi:DNA-binding response OmpR family regulator